VLVQASKDLAQSIDFNIGQRLSRHAAVPHLEFGQF
jgi:hypothetical protein